MSNVPNRPDAPQRGQLERKAPSAPASLEERVTQLEQLVAGMAKEVRTSRLVVVDDRGRERIVAEVDSDPAESAAIVQVRAADGPDTWVGMFAANIMEGGHPVAQVDLSVDGTIHSQLVAAPSGGFWRPERPAHVRRTDVRTELMVAGEVVLEGYSDQAANPRKADG